MILTIMTVVIVLAVVYIKLKSYYVKSIHTILITGIFRSNPLQISLRDPTLSSLDKALSNRFKNFYINDTEVTANELHVHVKYIDLDGNGKTEMFRFIRI